MRCKMRCGKYSKISSLIFILFILVNKTFPQTNSSITIDISTSVGDTIKPYIYGGFIEFLWDGIDNKYGLWAQEIGFRGLEKWNLVTKNPADTLPFFTINQGSNLNWSLDTSRYNLNDSCSRKIQITNYIKGHSGIGQLQVNIVSGETYDVYVYLKGNGIKKGVTIWLLENVKDWIVIDSITFKNTDDTWKKYSGTLTSNSSLNYGIFAITVQEEATLWIDEISMMPQSAINGVRKEYLDKIKILKPTIMRYPGGCFADGQASHWLNGVGDIDKRATRIDSHWNSYQRMDFGTDEFIQYCRNTNIEPQITVNFGSGTPQEAANWVEYVNGDVNTTYGKLRASNGHPQPYKVKYWEVGNEQYGSWEIGHTSAREYASRFNEYVDNMKSKDPSIKIMANGDLEHLDWTNTLLTISGDKMDYLSIHFAAPFDDQFQHTDEEIYYAVVAASEYFKILFDAVKHSIDSITAGKVKLIVSEWWNDYGNAFSAHSSSLEEAIHAGGMLNFFQQKSKVLDIVNRSTFIEILKAYNPRFEFFLAPSAYVLSLYSNYSGNILLKSNVISPTYSLPRSVGNIPAMDSIPYLDVSATKKNDKIFINVVNRSLEDITTMINLTGGGVESNGIIRTVNGPNFLSNNFEPPYNTVTINSSQISNIGKSFNYKFPAHSVTGIELTAKVTSIETDELSITNYSLKNAYPNPFNPSTTIGFSIPQHERVTLKVFDILGREVETLVDDKLEPGEHSVVFNAKNLSSGVYLYRLATPTFSQTKMMGLVK